MPQIELTPDYIVRSCTKNDKPYTDRLLKNLILMLSCIAALILLIATGLLGNFSGAAQFVFCTGLIVMAIVFLVFSTGAQRKINELNFGRNAISRRDFIIVEDIIEDKALCYDHYNVDNKFGHALQLRQTGDHEFVSDEAYYERRGGTVFVLCSRRMLGKRQPLDINTPERKHTYFYAIFPCSKYYLSNELRQFCTRLPYTVYHKSMNDVAYPGCPCFRQKVFVSRNDIKIMQGGIRIIDDILIDFYKDLDTDGGYGNMSYGESVYNSYGELHISPSTRVAYITKCMFTGVHLISRENYQFCYPNEHIFIVLDMNGNCLYQFPADKFVLAQDLFKLVERPWLNKTKQMEKEVN